jgi:copper chaperone CopZ
MIYKSIAVTIIALVFSAISLFAASPKEISVQTNLHCESCATKIEKGLKKVSGVLESKANVDTKIVAIKFDSDKTNESKITKTIADLGYKADLVKSCDEKSCTDTKKVKNSGKDCCDTKATKSAPKK